MIPTDPGSRLDVIERHLFGETVHEKRAKEEREFRDSLSVVKTAGLNLCTKCGLTMTNDLKPFGYSDAFLINLGRAPLHERCHHKKTV